jgi:hypothetical protein
VPPAPPTEARASTVEGYNYGVPTPAAANASQVAEADRSAALAESEDSFDPLPVVAKGGDRLLKALARE